MALKKQTTEEKYLYAKIENLNYSKNNLINFSVAIYEKKILDNLVLNANSIQFYIDESKKDSLDKFSIVEMDKENNNIFKIAYVYLKENVSLFSDFEDC